MGTFPGPLSLPDSSTHWRNTMQTRTFAALALAASLAAGVIGTASAQTPPPPPPHHGLFGKLFHPRPKPGQPTTYRPGMMGRPGMMHPGMMRRPGVMGRPSMGGGIVGNRNSHVYHLPGDRGALPAPQNRVYFHTAAQAEAAGYHRAGMTGGMSRRPMMHGSPTHGMTH